MSTTAKTVSRWSATSIYTAGMEVIENGVIYVANWWTQDNNPASNNGVIGTGEPWTIVSSGSGTVPLPSVPAKLAASKTTSSGTTLSWSASTVSGGTVTGYAVFENGRQIATVTATSYAVTGLSASTAYSFAVAAIDSAGESAESTALKVTTQAAAKLPVPTTPGGLAASGTTDDSTTITWTAASVSGGSVTDYAVYENGTQVGTVTATSYTATGLSAATAYSFTVSAIDSSGASAQSAALDVTTLAGTTAPPASGPVPAWSATAIYTAGMEASEAGIVYTANWWTQDNDPATNNGGPNTGEPWTITGKVNTTPTVPNAPTGLTATATSSTQVDLYWTASTVNGSGTVSGYAVFENGTQIATTSASDTYYDAGSLNPSTQYNFTVDAIDATGASPQSTAASATTLAAGQVSSTAVYAPYIDMGLWGTPELAAISQASGIKDFTLAFIQSSGAGTIGWAGTGTITSDVTADGSTILQQVQGLEAIGGNVIISFGGAAGTDPATVAGTTAASLQAEYQSVINRYGVTSLDFDIEGAPETNQASLVLRDQALVGLKAANPDLQISYTLPVLPTGLDANGMNIIQTAAKDGVDINVINIMAMDYGTSVDNNGAMGTDAIDAIQATEKQVAATGLSAKLGVTPLIGVNDVSPEVFTLADAQQLANYVATDPDVVRVAMWSVTRDNGSAAGATSDVNNGSGLAQSNYAFSAIFEHA